MRIYILRYINKFVTDKKKKKNKHLFHALNIYFPV